MGFEVFDKRKAPMRGAPSVTMQRRGILSINAPAHSLIGGAMVVELLFDRDRNVMAIRPAESSPSAYKLREPSKAGLTILSAAAFTEAYEIDTSVSRRYAPFMEDGMLCIDFNGPSTEVHGNRAKAKARETEQEQSVSEA